MRLPLRLVRWLAVLIPVTTVVAYETLRHAWIEPLPAALLGNALGGLLVGGAAAVVASQLLGRVERVQSELARAREREALLHERQRLAATLHDDVAQVLFWTGVRIDEARAKLRQGQVDAAADSLDAVRQTIEAARSRLRETIQTLRDETRRGSSDGFWSQVAQLARDAGLRLQGDPALPTDVPPPPGRVVSDVLGLIQEAFWNVTKHAGTDRVEVRALAREGTWQLQIRDRGRGFNPDGPTAGLGLVLMRERAARAGGRLLIESAPGGGTRLTLAIPAATMDEGGEVACVS